MDSNSLFGGKVVVFLGDFRQLPPVIRGGKGENKSLIAAEWFRKAVNVMFTRNFRSRDSEFANMLERIGDGYIDRIEIPSQCIAHCLDDAIHQVYGHQITDDVNVANMMLAFTLEQCHLVNSRVLEMMPSELGVSDAVDDLTQCKSPDEYPPEYIASLHIQGTPPSQLPLKIKARYLIMRNIHPPNVCNGILAELVSFTRMICTMRLLSGPGLGNIVHLPRCSFLVTSEMTGLPFNFQRRQFPMTLAYCVTVHKSQGQTLRKIGIVVDTDPFAHGMVYVGKTSNYFKPSTLGVEPHSVICSFQSSRLLVRCRFLQPPRGNLHREQCL
jgi:hypothetical protein